MGREYFIDITMLDKSKLKNKTLKEVTCIPNGHNGGYTICTRVPDNTTSIDIFFADGDMDISEIGQRARCYIIFEDNTKKEIIFHVKPLSGTYSINLPKNIITKHIVCELNIDDKKYNYKTYRSNDSEVEEYFEFPRYADFREDPITLVDNKNYHIEIELSTGIQVI